MKRALLFLTIVMSLVMVFCLSANAMTGSGTEADPFIVETADDFVSIQSRLDAHYKLSSDISVSSQTGAIVEGIFAGVFDGDGHTITVSITGATSGTNTYDSLFGVVSGQIKNLIIKGNITGSDKVSGVVAKLQGSGNVDNCINYATITGRKNIGGIVGLIVGNATVTNCANFGAINGSSPISNGLDMGGIVGCVWNDGKTIVVISNCFNAGTIYGQGYNCAGICGHINGGKYENLFNIGEITSTTNPTSEGSFFGEMAGNFSQYALSGYYSTESEPPVANGNGKVLDLSNPLLESTGVAIYLGAGSGIRGEFHINESLLSIFSKYLTLAGYDIEYGAVVTTKLVLLSVNGNLLSSEEIANDLIVFAPAFADGQKQYSYVDSIKGDAFHSFRFALTNFPDNEEAYNMEFVILGYIKLIDKNDNEQLFPINTVLSSRLASEVGETGLNAVSIVRVAEATIDDGDFNGNIEALDKLNHIIGLKNYEAKIDIDGVVGYGHKNATFTKSISSDDTVVFQISNTDVTEFLVYINSLENNGYERISENTINGNIFYVFKNGDTLINATHTASTGNVTISKETITNLPSNLTAPSFEKKTTPSITQLKLEASIPEGMSYVVRLSDGTFFIIDGGWCDNDAKEADKLYNTLVALAGEGNDIVIAGWIFTHCHGDHIGTFNIFVEKYHDSVTIKELLYNFPSDADISNSGSSYMLDNSKQRYGYFRTVISTYLPDTKFVKLHSGYKFYYADLEVEILQTLEDLYPSTVANYDFNSSSTIFTIKIGGQKMLFVGDVSDVGATRLNSVYGSTLKSDFIQVAHHGLNSSGTIKTMYINADATYVLYPAPSSWFEGNGANNANFYLQVESKTVKQIFVSGYNTFTLALPYDGKDFDGIKIPGKAVEIPDDSDSNEVARPETNVNVPDAYFDLSFSNGQITDAMGNATVTVNGGEITESTVTHNGQEATTQAYTGDRYKGNYYLTLNFNDITSDSQMGEFVMGSSTFEIFLRLDKLPGKTVGLITSCNGGGFTLYMRKDSGQLNFEIGSTNPNANSDAGLGKGNYSAVVPMNDLSAPLAVSGELLHIVGSYNASTNMMKLYVNGMLIAEADFGEGSFKGGSGNDYIVGIGHNPQYPSEEISSYANYELYEAKIYNTALTDEQVAQEYWNCIDNIFPQEAVNE